MDDAAIALHYRLRADEVRSIAESLADSGARHLMDSLADQWEAMAERARERAELTARSRATPSAPERRRPQSV